MKCHYCEEQIRDGSEVCPYCGKQQRVSAPCQNLSSEESRREEKRGSLAYLGVGVAVLTYLILLFKMVSGVIGYLLGCVILVGVLVSITKIKNKVKSKTYCTVLIVLSSLLLVATIGLRIVYEAKVEKAEADIPTEGTVRLKVTMDEEFTSPIYEGMVRDPYSYLTIGNQKYEGTSVVTVILNEAYPIEIAAGHGGRTGVAGSLETGLLETSICFTADMLEKGVSNTYSVALSGYSTAKVTICFERVCSFWDVIFYQNS